MQPGLVSVFFYLLLASAFCRLLTCLLLLPLFRELRQVQPFPVHQWIFQIARIRIPVGVGFDAEPMDDEEEDKVNENGGPNARPEPEPKGTAATGDKK
jgi:hypothetical protein